MLQLSTQLSFERSAKYPVGQEAVHDPSKGLKNRTLGMVLQFLTQVRVTESEKKPVGHYRTQLWVEGLAKVE